MLFFMYFLLSVLGSTSYMFKECGGSKCQISKISQEQAQAAYRVQLPSNSFQMQCWCFISQLRKFSQFSILPIRVTSIYKICDVGILNNLIGSPPPGRWVIGSLKQCRAGVTLWEYQLLSSVSENSGF